MGKYYVGYFPVIGKLCNRLEIPRKHRNGVGNSRTSGKQDPTSLIQFLRKKKKRLGGVRNFCGFRSQKATDQSEEFL